MAQLPAAVDREIAKFLHDQEQIDEARKESARLQSLLEQYAAMARSELDARVLKAFERARLKATASTLESFERELARLRDEEELALLILLNQ